MSKTICFLGDSITATGLWESEIFEKARHGKLRLYNCGVSGDNATAALSRIYTTCLCYNPDIVSVMFGVNDNNCGYYYNKEREPGQLERERLEAEQKFELYKKSMRRLCEIITEAGAQLILCTPVPFDNVTPGEMDKDLSIPLDRAVPFVKELAAEFGAKIVDFNGEMKKKMACERIFNDDRVHPTERGYRIMAEIWSRDMLDGRYATNAEEELKFCERLSKRREVEIILNKVNLIEYSFFHHLRIRDGGSLAERIAEAETRLERAKALGVEKEIIWYSSYLDNINNYSSLMSEYIRLTIELSEGMS